MLSDSGDSDVEEVATKVVRKTPWWSISMGLHLLTALALGFFWAVDAHVELEVLTTAVPRTRPPQIEFEPRKDDEKKPILETAERSEEVVFTREPATENQTPDDEEFNTAKGDSPEMVSDKPFQGKGTYDVIGGSCGGGGRFGHRLGGKYKLAELGGGRGTTDVVLNALRWLARHQNPDGSWSVNGYLARCSDSCSPNPGEADFDAGVTGLSMLAFLGAGYSHLSKDIHDGIRFGDVVRKGLQWMMSQQDPEGCVGSRASMKYMYSHLICALALTEAYGLTGSHLFKDNAQRAVDFTVAAQNPGKGWRYSYKCGDNDGSVTGWAAMVLKSAEISGLTFPRSAYDGTRAWYDESTEASYGRVGYTQAGTGKVFIPGKNEQFDHNEALTSIGIMSRIFIDKTRNDPRIASGVDLLLRQKPEHNGNATDFYYWYYASLALFQYDGPSGPKWTAWNEPMKTALVKSQNLAASGCRRGSWEPVDRWSCEGGRVYATAINALTLEVYYRYTNVFVGGK